MSASYPVEAVSAPDPCGPVIVIEPHTPKIRDNRPNLDWEPIPGATAYRVKLDSWIPEGQKVFSVKEWRARIIPGRPFPSYHGTAYSKSEVLDRAKFSICSENSRSSPGYVTEKIFDCFTSGCIPIYIGSTHRTALVPEDCYIDGDRFNSSARCGIFCNQSTLTATHAIRRQSSVF